MTDDDTPLQERATAQSSTHKHTQTKKTRVDSIDQKQRTYHLLPLLPLPLLLNQSVPLPAM